ncbi:MAG: ABC transporter permease [Bacteroidetes bacterium]|nr:MAG: ABC transporter permease [Bacteroidota bacterium]RLD83134.1 MAG: ABC transporter permease [Bacteroidota bacterium]
MNNLKMAWRNLWRNKRRTLITVSSIFFGVFLAALMNSMQEGSYSSMIDNVVKFYSGYIQIQNEEYWDKKTINNSFEINEELTDKIEKVQEITNYSERLESFCLASSETITQGALIVGVNPDKENEVTSLSKWIREDGQYLKNGENGVLVGELLSKHLKLNVGDTLVIIGQGYHGVSAAGKYPVKGILEFPSPELSKRFIYMDINIAQELFSAPNRFTSIALMVENQQYVDIANKELASIIEKPLTTMSWAEMQPELVQMIGSDRAGGVLMISILYIVIGFGIFGTIMMLMAERKREFAVMISVGMRKMKLVLIVIYETILIGVLGVLSGFIASSPIISYMSQNPIPLGGDAAQWMIDMGIEPVFAFSMAPEVFLKQAIIIFVMVLFVAIYPIASIKRLKVIQALRG